MVRLGASRRNQVELFSNDAGLGFVAALDVGIVDGVAKAVGGFERGESWLLLWEFEREAAARCQRFCGCSKQAAVVLVRSRHDLA